MDREKFRQIAEQHLVPLFSGATLLDDFESSTPRKAAVSWRDPCSLNIKPSKHAEYCCVLNRSQPFANKASSHMTEYRVIVAFTEVLHDIVGGIGTPMEQDLISHFVRRVVVKAVCSNPDHESQVLSVIDQFDTWATKLYEGQPISGAVGFTPASGTHGVSLGNMWAEDFAAVLTNGFDTLLVSDYGGIVHGYEALTTPEPMALPPFAPHRLAPVAEWTDRTPESIVIVLNRAGEILVIQNGQLVFARRGGDWHFLTHEPVITQMKCPHDKQVRRAVYASCLDASFARTGACVGIMTSGDTRMLKTVAPNPDDHVQTGSSVKAKLIRGIIGQKRFQELDRRLRHELLAIDGATILDYQGEILTVGAILHIDGGSSGGGRLAAATELGKYGTGIKVSQDGGIRGFYRCENQQPAIPAFVVM